MDEKIDLSNLAGFLHSVSENCSGIASVLTVHFAGLFPLMESSISIKTKNYIADYLLGNKFAGYTFSGQDHQENIIEKSLNFTSDNSNYILNGSISNVLMGGKASCLTAIAFDAPGDHCKLFFVDLSKPGIKFLENRQLTGLRVLPVCDIEFNNYNVPEEERIASGDAVLKIIFFPLLLLLEFFR